MNKIRMLHLLDSPVPVCPMSTGMRLSQIHQIHASPSCRSPPPILNTAQNRTELVPPWFLGNGPSTNTTNLRCISLCPRYRFGASLDAASYAPLIQPNTEHNTKTKDFPSHARQIAYVDVPSHAHVIGSSRGCAWVLLHQVPERTRRTLLGRRARLPEGEKQRDRGCQREKRERTHMCFFYVRVPTAGREDVAIPSHCASHGASRHTPSTTQAQRNRA